MTVGHSKKMGNLRKKLSSINKVRLFGKLPPAPCTELAERAIHVQVKGALAKGKGLSGGRWVEGGGQWWRSTKPSICDDMYKHKRAVPRQVNFPSLRLATIDGGPGKSYKV